VSGGDFDFVHTRWLLHHLPEPEVAIRRMTDALRPGGWLLLEEVDFFPVHTSTSLVYAEFMAALTGSVVQASGRDCFWARALPELVAGMGLHQVGGEGDVSLLQGGSPIAEFFVLTAEQMRERMLSSGTMTAERFGEAIRLLLRQSSGPLAAAALPSGLSVRTSSAITWCLTQTTCDWRQPPTSRISNLSPVRIKPGSALRLRQPPRRFDQAGVVVRGLPRGLSPARTD
jgi:hypothetical protein